ncbi:MAG: hypothetical protein KHW93_11210, partial [Butyricicoccus pullicaecorum]|nr:hypothetical protein [Butyricicoccus pullicaecorum]
DFYLQILSYYSLIFISWKCATCLTERDYTAPEVPIDAMRSDTLHAHDKGVTQDAHPIPR